MSGLIGLSLMAALPALADEPRQGEVRLVQPSPKPPRIRQGPFKGQLANEARAAAPPSGELASLRAVSLREGSGVISFAGTTRPVRPGDRLARATVKAVGSDRLVLEGPATSSGTGAALIVVTFGPGGEARVRTFIALTEAMPPPESR
jgi:hypothetical protein